MKLLIDNKMSFIFGQAIAGVLIQSDGELIVRSSTCVIDVQLLSAIKEKFPFCTGALVQHGWGTCVGNAAESSKMRAECDLQ